MKTRPVEPQRRTSSAAGGFSLIEVLVAALLLLVIALGLIPLFTRAMLDNASGRDATTATNFDRSQFESLKPMPTSSTPMTVLAGQTVLTTQETWSRGNPKVENDSSEGWVAGVVSNTATSRWTRTTRVRQFNGSDLQDRSLDSPLVGGITMSSQVHFKEIEVSVQGTNQNVILGSILGGGPRVTFRSLRSI